VIGMGGREKIWGLGNWRVKGSTDPGPSPSPVQLSIGGRLVGSFSRLEFHHPVPGFGWPQLVALDGAGYIRLCPPVADWGTSFCFTGYWSDGKYFHTLKVSRLDALLDPKDEVSLLLRGEAADDLEEPHISSPDFTLRLHRPVAHQVRVGVCYSLVAKRPFSIDKLRQARGEGFKVAQFSSMWVGGMAFDADEARHEEVSVKFSGFGWIFPSPLRMKGRLVRLIHTHRPAGEREKPDCGILLNSPSFKECSLQGWIGDTCDPSQDNVGLWINWDRAPLRFAKGMRVGPFDYFLEASAKP